MNISNLEVTRNYEGLGTDAVQFTLTTERGSADLLEWLDGDKVARTDSHMKINGLEEVAALFDLSEKPSLMPLRDFIEFGEIFDLIDAELAKVAA